MIACSARCGVLPFTLSVYGETARPGSEAHQHLVMTFVTGRGGAHRVNCQRSNARRGGRNAGRHYDRSRFASCGQAVFRQSGIDLSALADMGALAAALHPGAGRSISTPPLAPIGGRQPAWRGGILRGVPLGVVALRPGSFRLHATRLSVGDGALGADHRSVRARNPAYLYEWL
jgi:hypothetical protein